MMNFIRKIHDGVKDKWVHKNFTRYGKGNYENRALIEIKKGKSKTTIKTGFEFSGELAYQLAESIEGTIPVKGGIITTKDISSEMDFAGQKQFAGVKTFLIDTEMSKEEVQGLFEKFPTAPIFLTFKTSEGEIKTKVKSPKAAKAGKNGEEPKADFCTFKTTNEKIIKDLSFDIDSDFKKLFIKHTFVIDSLDVPDKYKDEFKLAREHATRKGKIIRELTVDEVNSQSEFSLIA